MSHITTVQTQFNDLEALKAAAKNLGAELTACESGVRYWSGRQPADYMIALPGNYDLGFKQQQTDGTFSMVCDGELLSGDFGRGGEGRKIIGENAFRLKQEYAAAVIELEGAVMGWATERRVEADGSVYVTLVE